MEASAVGDTNALATETPTATPPAWTPKRLACAQRASESAKIDTLPVVRTFAFEPIDAATLGSFSESAMFSVLAPMPTAMAKLLASVVVVGSAMMTKPPTVPAPCPTWAESLSSARVVPCSIAWATAAPAARPTEPTPPSASAVSARLLSARMINRLAWGI